jgi:hypothetical protein
MGRRGGRAGGALRLPRDVVGGIVERSELGVRVFERGVARHAFPDEAGGAQGGSEDEGRRDDEL